MAKVIVFARLVALHINVEVELKYDLSLPYFKSWRETVSIPVLLESMTLNISLKISVLNAAASNNV